MRALLFGLVFALHLATAGLAAGLNPKVTSALSTVEQAVVEVQKKQAAMPPPRDDVERLLRMKELDQAPRDAVGQVDLTKLDEEERGQFFAGVRQVMAPIDSANQTQLLKMVPPEGWFSIGRYGREASTAAFLIVQHSTPDLMRRFLPVLKELADRKEIDGAGYALMSDRVARAEGRPQLYGSQMTCVAGRRVPAPIEDRNQIDKRRQALGMKPYADYLKMFEDDVC